MEWCEDTYSRCIHSSQLFVKLSIPRINPCLKPIIFSNHDIRFESLSLSDQPYSCHDIQFESCLSFDSWSSIWFINAIHHLWINATFPATVAVHAVCSFLLSWQLEQFQRSLEFGLCSWCASYIPCINTLLCISNISCTRTGTWLSYIGDLNVWGIHRAWDILSKWLLFDIRRMEV